MNISFDTLMTNQYIQYIKDKALVLFGPLQKKVALIALAIIGGVTACYFMYCFYLRHKNLQKIIQKVQPNSVKQDPLSIDKEIQSLFTAQAPLQEFKQKVKVELELESKVAKEEKTDVIVEKEKPGVTAAEEEKTDAIAKEEKTDTIEEEKPGVTAAEEEKTDVTAEEEEKPDLTAAEEEKIDSIAKEEKIDTIEEEKPDVTVANPTQVKEAEASKPKPPITDRLVKNLDYALKQQKQEISKGKFKITEGSVPEIVKIQSHDGWSPVTIQRPLEGRKEEINGKEVGIACCQGRRGSMEDEELVTSLEFTIQGQLYKGELFGVFDGHGGKEASKYVKEHLVKYLITALQEEVTQGNTYEEHIFKALKACCQKLDQSYIKRKDGTPTTDGTTATFALILGEKIWVANVGDSCTALSNDRKAIKLTEAAKPSIKRYKDKIEKLGGAVFYGGRVFGGRAKGSLGVARAIGDHGYTDDKGNKCVIPRPKISCYPLSEIQNGYLILACDGVDEVWTTDETVQAVNDRVDKGESVDLIAKRLVWSVINSGSEDNVSMIIVKL